MFYLDEINNPWPNANAGLVILYLWKGLLVVSCGVFMIYDNQLSVL